MKKIFVFLLFFLFIGCMTGCRTEKQPKIGVAFGVGPALRWQQEIQYMEAYAKELGIEFRHRFNTNEKTKPFDSDCIELIDSGIDVLIIRPRNVANMKNVVDYAHRKNVKIISYDSLIENEKIDFFIGYDSEHIGQHLGRYLSELVPKGTYILIWGDENRNVKDMYRGAMHYFEPLSEDIAILLATDVPGWSPAEAKRIVKDAVSANGNKIDAIMAFNDNLAGACAEAIAELGITEPVYISGMDAELDALKRIVAGTQACTAYMDIKSLAHAAINEAILLAKNNKTKHNYEIDNNSGTVIPSYLLARQLVIKSNIDRVLIKSGYYTAEQVYGQ